MRGLRGICQADRAQQTVRSRHGAGIWAIVVAGLLAGSQLTGFGAASEGQTASAHKSTQDQSTEATTVTPVAGPSWIHHLGLPYGETTLGRSAATYGPPAEERPGATAMPLGVGQPVVLTGADLYRLNCQACHRAEGTGSPPEIKSVLGAVAGSSAEFVRRQLRQQGITGAVSAAREQASRARSDLTTGLNAAGSGCHRCRISRRPTSLCSTPTSPILPARPMNYPSLGSPSVGPDSASRDQGHLSHLS